MAFIFFYFKRLRITLNYVDKINNFRDLVNFQIRRFWRLYPTHIFVLFIVLFIQILKLLTVNYIGVKSGQVPFGDWYSLKDFLANVLLIQSIFNNFNFLS
jgi:peptidoglycan/LPS O-acetylase OafA/YrhL